MIVPAPVEVIVLAGWKAGVIEGQGCAGSMRAEFKVDDRVDPGVPMGRTPGLDDALVLDQLHVAAHNEPSKQGEGPARSWVDGGRQPGEGGELLLVQQGDVDALWGGLEFEIVVNGGARLVGGCGGFLLHRGLLGARPLTHESAAAGNDDGGGCLAAGDRCSLAHCFLAMRLKPAGG